MVSPPTAFCCASPFNTFLKLPFARNCCSLVASANTSLPSTHLQDKMSLFYQAASSTLLRNIGNVHFFPNEKVSLGNPLEKEWRGMILKQAIQVLEKPLCLLGRAQDYSLFFQLRSSFLCTWFSKNVNSPAPSCLQARKYVDQIWLQGRPWKG